MATRLSPVSRAAASSLSHRMPLTLWQKLAARSSVERASPFWAALWLRLMTAVLSPEKLKSYFPAVWGVGRGYHSGSPPRLTRSRATPPG